MRGLPVLIMQLLIGVMAFLTGCGVEATTNQNARAEVVVHYPEMARCFDLYEQERLTYVQFRHCIETASEHTLTVDVDGELTEILLDEELGNAS